MWWCLLLFMLTTTQRWAGATQAGQMVRAAVKQGPLVGFVDTNELGSLFTSFLGIPYALPPVGKLRFKDPVPHPGWTGAELVADKYGPLCPQWDAVNNRVSGDENCLTLNVFTPVMPSSFEGQPLPVMFYVHGGAFLKGGSQLYGAAKLMGEPVVLVTINYRLGVLGFLCTEDKWGPGNYAMMDLVLGLKWVHENIVLLGGDPRRVTIFGESAGAAAVSLLTLSPLAKGYFWAAITQSGSALCDWSVEEHPGTYAIAVASHLGCDIHSSVAILQCLRHQSPEDIVAAQQAQLKFSYFPLRAAPVVDRYYRKMPFLPNLPEKLLLNGNFSQVPLISGVVTHEGILFALQILLSNAKRMAEDPYYFEEVVLPTTVEGISDNLYSRGNMEQIKNFYFRDVDMRDVEDVIPPFVDLLSDVLFFSCNDKAIKLHSRYAPVYSYVLTHRANQSYAQQLIGKANLKNIRSDVLQKGVSHADDLLYLFNLPGFQDLHQWPADYHVQNTMIKLWTTFAQSGTPNRPAAASPGQPAIFWTNAKETEMCYLEICSYSHVGRDFRKFELSIFEFIRVSFWPTPQPYIDGDTASGPYYIATWVLLAIAGLLLLIAIVLAVLLVQAQRKRTYSTDQLDPYGQLKHKNKHKQKKT